MTCKDCIHYAVCKEHEKIMLTVNNLYELIYQSGVEVSCKHFSTADVAPKSEVAREIFEEIENIIKSPHTVGFTLTAPLKEALKEYNDGIRKEKLYYISKLKRKYTEDKG